MGSRVRRGNKLPDLGQKHGENRFLLDCLPQLHCRYDRETTLNTDFARLPVIAPTTLFAFPTVQSHAVG